MQVTCSKCNSKYRISDSKLKGRDRIRLKCKKCDNIIESKVPAASDDESSLFSTSSNKTISKAVNSKDNSSDIFEDNLFSSASKEEFSFEDAKQTLVLDRDTGGPPSFKEEPKEEAPKFKSDFQMDFSDKTSSHNKFDNAPNNARQSAAISFETTQQISVDKFNEYQENKKLALAQESSQVSSPSLKQENTSRQTNTGIDNKTRNKFDEIAKEFDKGSSKGGGVLKLLLVLLIVLSLVSTFVLFKNNWKLDLNNIPQMITNAFGGETQGKTVVKEKKKVKSFKDQFFIDGKKIKANIFKMYRRGKKHVLTVSGEIKNIDNVKKSLTTVLVKVQNISNNEIILEKRVYAGNFFTKKEIIKAKNDETLSAEYLQSGKNGANWDVQPNKVVPFMVVFYLPKKINLSKIKIKVEVKSTQ